MKNKFSIAMTLAVIMAMLVTSLALADNVQDDVSGSGPVTFVAGGSTTIKYWIQDTGSDGCGASDGSPALITINAPAGVTATPSSLSFSACGTSSSNTQSVVYTSNSPDTYSVTLGATDSGGDSYNTNPSNVTLTVNAPPPPSDTTPPSISYVLNPASPDGANGWYKSDVTLTWTVAEPESLGSLVKTGCVDQSITADQGPTTYSCSATSDGGSAAQVDVSIKRDATAPSISANAGSYVADTWTNQDVTVHYACTDSGSGVANVTDDQLFNTDGVTLSTSGSCTDNAGNTASASFGPIKIDKTAPTVSLVGGPADGGSYYFGSVPAAPTCTASDALSGLAAPCSVSGYSDLVGNHTVSASAADNAGNSGSASASYEVKAWTLNGFYQPVDMNGVFNVVKGGSTVPFKFEVFAGSTELTDVAYLTGFKYGSVACDATAANDAIETLATGETSLRYDWTSGQFIYNWKTPKTPGCFSVTMTADDGSTLTAFFKIK